jgi:hypothetical protein
LHDPLLETTGLFRAASERLLKGRSRACAHTVITSFARSTPTVVISIRDFPLVLIDDQNLNLGTQMPCGSTASSAGSLLIFVRADRGPSWAASGRGLAIVAGRSTRPLADEVGSPEYTFLADK